MSGVPAEFLVADDEMRALLGITPVRERGRSKSMVGGECQSAV